MADRNTPASATFEEWRVEFNELATDVGDISNLPSSINGQSVTDVIEAITQVNNGLQGVLFPTVIDFDDSTGASSERIKFGTGDDLQIFHDSNNSIIEHSGTGNLQLKNNGQTFTLPATGGNISTEGFSIAVAVALG
mgnify:CR=1 FL=1|tara:strand:- start:12 stop:422 length:411 start_codon:yes stop_codon:yes gene_type:complete